MGGKRPDQVHIDPRDGRVTDAKTLTNDEHIHTEDKQKLNARPEEDSLIPQRGDNPALEALKRRREPSGGE